MYWPWYRQDRRRLCIHEAGHAVTALALGGTVRTIVVDPTERQIGAMRWMDNLSQALGLSTRADREAAGYTWVEGLPNKGAKIGYAVAGALAERLAGFEPNDGSDGDIDSALRLGDSQSIPPAVTNTIDVLRKHWPAVEALAEQADVHGQLDEREIATIWQQHRRH